MANMEILIKTHGKCQAVRESEKLVFMLSS